MARDLTKDISQLVKNQFPSFYHDEGEMFIAFVKAYYEWLESNNQALYHSRRLAEYKDIDKTIDDFIIDFKNKYLSDVQFNVATNKRLFVKNALEFYRAKGSPRAVDLFFKLIYGLEARVYEPSRDLFRLSDNEWTNERYLELLPSDKNLNFVGKQIFGSISGATAFAEKLVRVKTGTKFVEVLYLSGLSDNFITNELIFAYDIDQSLTDEFRNEVVGSLTHFTITSSDANFKVGERLYVKTGSGKKAQVIVAAVQNAVGVVSFNFIDGGWGFSTNAQVIGSEKTLTLDDVRFTNNGYFYHNFPFEQFTTAKQDLIQINLETTNTASTTAALALNTGTNLFATIGDVNGARTVWEGILVDKSIPNSTLTINYTKSSYANNLTDDDRPISGNNEITFLYSGIDPEYYNSAINNVTGDGSDFFKRELHVNGVRIMGAGTVGGQTAVPDAWLEKVGRMFELFTDPTGTDINESAQRTVIKTLNGDNGTYHAAAGPTIQRVARGAGADYSTNFLTDAGIIFWNLTNLLDTHVHNDMVWYLNSTGSGYGVGEDDASEVIEHVFHTLHMHGLDAVSLKLYPQISADWNSGPLYNAMVEAYDGGFWDSSGYGGANFKTDPDAFEVAAKEYLYLLNFCMFDYSDLWDGDSLAPEWSDTVKTPAGIQANLPLGYALHNTYIAPVISKPSLATINSIFQDGNTPVQDDPSLAGASGYVVDVVSSSNVFEIDVTNTNSTDVSIEANVIATSNTCTIRYTTSDSDKNILAGEQFYQNDPVYGHRFAEATVLATAANNDGTHVDLRMDRGYFRTNVTMNRARNVNGVTDIDYTITRMSNVTIGFTSYGGGELNFRQLANTYTSNTELGTYGPGLANNVIGASTATATFRASSFDNLEGHTVIKTTDREGDLQEISDIGLTTVIDEVANVDIGDPTGSLFEWIHSGNTINYSTTTLNDALNYTESTIELGEIATFVTTSPGEGYGTDPLFIVYEPTMYHAERYDFYIRYKAEEVEKTYTIGEKLKVGDNEFGKIFAVDLVTRELYATRLHLTQTSNTGLSENLWTTEDPRIGQTMTGLTNGDSAIIEVIDEVRWLPRSGLNTDVEATALSGSGFITDLTILDSGFGYEGKRKDTTINAYVKGEEMTLASFEDPDKTAQVMGFNLSNGVAPGTHPNRRSFLSSDKYIHDNDFYQEYSYQVLTALPFSKYKNTLVDVLHLAGSKPFGGYVGTSEIKLNITTTETSAQFNIRNFGVFVNENTFYSANVA